MTCHDRDVMNRVVSRVLEIDGGQIRAYSGNYDFYDQQRVEFAAQHAAEYERQQAMLAKEERFIARFKGQPSRASAVQSRARMIDKIERIEPPRRHIERDFALPPCSRSGDDVLKVRGVSRRFGARVVHASLDLWIRRGERWAVMGANGAGKSTLLRMLAGADRPDAGDIALGASVEMAYFAQHHAENLDPTKTIMEELETAFPMAGVGVLKNLAGGFGFSGDDTDKMVSVLSGGEKTRLTLAKMLYARPNLLILDEPTNHLDLATKRMLVRALQNFEGTLVFVSHDREFLRHLATRVLELEPGKARIYPGTYGEYVVASGREAPGMRPLA
jgi:ATPase subunit of ABC transporter with duplicated ATPase domains